MLTTGGIHAIRGFFLSRRVPAAPISVARDPNTTSHGSRGKDRENGQGFGNPDLNGAAGQAEKIRDICQDHIERGDHAAKGDLPGS